MTKETGIGAGFAGSCGGGSGGGSTKPITFDESIHKLAEEIADLVINKQKDYGPRNILNSPFGVNVGLVVRIFDKLSRLYNLNEKAKKPTNENIEDTWMDIVGYALIGLMVQRGLFELPLKE